MYVIFPREVNAIFLEVLKFSWLEDPAGYSAKGAMVSSSPTGHLG
jgi:hypothetical protein